MKQLFPISGVSLIEFSPFRNESGKKIEIIINWISALDRTGRVSFSKEKPDVTIHQYGEVQ